MFVPSTKTTFQRGFVNDDVVFVLNACLACMKPWTVFPQCCGRAIAFITFVWRLGIWSAHQGPSIAFEEAPLKLAVLDYQGTRWTSKKFPEGSDQRSGTLHGMLQDDVFFLKTFFLFLPPMLDIFNESTFKPVWICD